MQNDALLDNDLQVTTPLDNDTISRINMLIIDINESTKFVREGRVTLFILCGLAAFGSIVLLTQLEDSYEQVGVGLEVALVILIYLGCALMASSYPRASMTIALSFYILYMLLNAAIDVETLGRGIIVKVLVVTYLIKAIRGAYQLHRQRERLQQLGAPTEVMQKVNRLQEVSRLARN